MQVCTSPQTDNHAKTSPLSFLQAGCPSCRPTNSVKALKAQESNYHYTTFSSKITVSSWVTGWIQGDKSNNTATV